MLCKAFSTIFAPLSALARVSADTAEAADALRATSCTVAFISFMRNGKPEGLVWAGIDNENLAQTTTSQIDFGTKGGIYAYDTKGIMMLNRDLKAFGRDDSKKPYVAEILKTPEGLVRFTGEDGGNKTVFYRAMVPLRSALIVKEHGTLAYPEGTACAEVLIAGEEGGAKASTVFAGLGIAAGYKFIADGLKVFPSEVAYQIPGYKGAGIGMDVLPALAGVGYICGVKVSSYLFAGGVTAWFILMPLIALFGGDVIMFPADKTVSALLMEGGPDAIWSKFIRYIGAGAVLAGGIMSLISSLPLIVRTFKDAIGGYGKNGVSTLRTEQDLSMKFLMIGVAVLAVALWLIPTIPLNLFGAILVVIFGFFFATVSSRMVGLIGSSNNPVSGMAIATLLISTLLLKATGQDGPQGMTAAITIGGIICVIAAIAGDTSQDLKTGFLVGATPKKQQIGEIIGCIVSAIAIGAIMYLLSAAWGYGSHELPAPQAMLMKMVVEGVMGGNLPWTLVFTGIFIAIVVKVLGIPVLPFAIGLYLPIYLSTPIMAGGLLRWFMEKRKYADEKAKNDAVQSGVLYTSGLIAGEGIVGIVLAVFAVVGLNVDISGVFSIGRIGALVCFAVILYTIYAYAKKGAKAAEQDAVKSSK